MRAWQELLSKLEKQFSLPVAKQWLYPIRVLRFDAANLYLEATPFQRSWFEEHAKPYLASFRNENQRPIRIHWSLPSPPSEKKQEIKAPIQPIPIEEEHLLSHFVSGNNNKVALEVALLLSRQEAIHGNPLLYWGPKGCGKSHLLKGLMLALERKGKQPLYVKAEDFIHQVIQAMRLGLMREFRQTYRHTDLFLLDDVHLFARKAASQEELFHTFNFLHSLGTPIVITSRKPPHQLVDIEPRLISRFEWGIAFPLMPLEKDAWKQVLEERATTLRWELPPAVSLFLSRHFNQLSSALEALHALVLRAHSPSQIGKIEVLLADLLEKEAKGALTMEKIVEETSHHFGLTPKDLLGKSQTKECAQPRHIAIFLCRKLLQAPFQTIGKWFQRDHSTIMSSVARIEKALSDKTGATLAYVEQLVRKLQI